MKKRVYFVLLILALILLTGCGSEEEVNSELVVVKVGLVGEMTEMWEPVQENLNDDNIKIEIVKFADYTLPNQALADGEIDLNAFQHVAFLNNEVNSKNLKLVPIGNTIIAPLNLYSKNIEYISQLKDGDKIAIPNDLTNGGRGLKVLESAGIIKVDESKGYVPSVTDIIENPLNIEFIEVEASNIPSLLPDVAAAIINGNHAHDYGLSPEDDAIYSIPVDEIKPDNPYINIIVAREEDKDNEIYLKIVEAYNQPNVAQVINDTYGGLYVPAWGN